jgi:Fe-S-cluster containining protein
MVTESISSSTEPKNRATSAVRFGCVGCGACCRGHFVPLTLRETRSWLDRGHPVAILLEAFDESLWPSRAPAYDYNVLRSAAVVCGSGNIRVTAIFAANVLNGCPNLQSDELCSIYSERPLVCRIYPAEINPFITLDPSLKNCPTESWEQGELIASDNMISACIQEARQADRDDALYKVALCEALGFTVAAWKSHGFVIHLPDVNDLIKALDTTASDRLPMQPWTLRVDNGALRENLLFKQMEFDDHLNSGHIFHRLVP